MPTRSCVVCKKRDEKKNLIRIVSIEGKAIIDKKVLQFFVNCAII